MFNDKSIVLNFAVLSDIHISGIWGMEKREKRFKDVLKFCNQKAGGRVEAFLINGDFTDAMNSKPNVVISEAAFPEIMKRQRPFRLLTSSALSVAPLQQLMKKPILYIP